MALPDLTVDMDGVLCRPPVWLNLAISRDVHNAPRFEARSGRLRHLLPARLLDSRPAQVVRYDLRRPMPRVAEGLTQLANVRRLVLLSGRTESSRKATERWLSHHGLREYFDEVVLNDRGLSNAAFKLATVRERGVLQHIDDDGRVAYWLAREAPRVVFLIAWRRNGGLPYPPTVHRIRDLVEVAERISQVATLPST